MRLTQQTDYALRVLVHLARGGSSPATISEVARACGIPQQQLGKIVHRLKRSGFVTTMRGRGGGFRLSRPPLDINLGHLVRAVEPDFAIVECMGRRATCPIIASCNVSRITRDALAGFLAVFDSRTLAEAASLPAANGCGEDP